jgi:hypothetical protein
MLAKMANSQQNVLESKNDQQRMDLHFEVRWSRQGENLMAGAARRKRERSQLGGSMFQTALVNSQTSDFRFERPPRNPQLRSHA